MTWEPEPRARFTRDPAVEALVAMLVERREELGMTLTDLGRRMGLGSERSSPASPVQLYEQHGTTFSVSRLLTWVAALGCELVLEPVLDADALRRRWSPPAGGGQVPVDRARLANVIETLEYVAGRQAARSREMVALQGVVGVLQSLLDGPDYERVQEPRDVEALRATVEVLQRLMNGPQ